jgi:hypothetical protein
MDVRTPGLGIKAGAAKLNVGASRSTYERQYLSQVPRMEAQAVVALRMR